MLFSAITVNVYVPGTVGVPEIVPLFVTDIPAGSFDSSRTDHLAYTPPYVRRSKSYESLTDTEGSDGVSISGAFVTLTS